MTVTPNSKIGILISAPPERESFGHGLNLARAARARGVEVYLYLIDEAVRGGGDSRLEELRGLGAKMHVCAYALERHPEVSSVTREADPLLRKAGLVALNDLIVGTDRFVSFN